MILLKRALFPCAVHSHTLNLWSVQWIWLTEVSKAAVSIGDVGLVISNLSNVLEELVSKLNVFMWIGDEIARVNGCHSFLPHLTFHLGPSVCGLCLVTPTS